MRAASHDTDVAPWPRRGREAYTTANGATANMNLGGKDFLVQQNWVNSGSGGCRLSW